MGQGNPPGKRTRARQVMPADIDRDWFDQNPDQDWYVRPITDTELNLLKMAGEPPQTHVLITQLAPGVRKRQFVTMTYLSDN